jgi:hypothetical protein
MGRSHISKFCGAIFDDSRRMAELHSSFTVESFLVGHMTQFGVMIHRLKAVLWKTQPPGRKYS